ncbi:preprotein translocase subunit YajC [Leucobacter tenebrionis]|uniref:preprotein translocase subunit YajC n=1 Tax=Leucobacter tenebrionis TaxID=2873270 RepID=UPI001CA6E250|nr:preprotein translocase subunit YajC [Leucobacter tenebrionis]QZY52220.1 preprotein translocase subunit YajC [Leucobacter tenebrionis]
MALDPISILMFGLIAVLIFFMFRNGKKRQRAMQELQNGLRPGAEVMLQSGIYGTIESIDEEDNRATLRSGTTTIVVHRNAISQIVTPVEGADEAEPTSPAFAPDDDPEFGERLAKGAPDSTTDESRPAADAGDESDRPEGDDRTDGQTPRA